MIWLLAVQAHAIRPTEGGLWAFAAEDQVEFYDEPTGQLRTHYSVAGPSVVDLTDADADGVPDYVELAAETGVAALELYAQHGFRLPLRESDLGFGSLGGSGALDLYLIDFAGDSDGTYQVDGCTSAAPVQCSGFLMVENDFKGYRYANDAEALGVVVPHELFHGVQLAYNGELDVWASEGTATWAERLFDPESEDFLSLASAYLEEPTRSVDDPPIGPAPWFAYGTALWFDFLTLRHDNHLVVELLEAWESAGDDLTTPMLAVIEARGDVVSDAWITFSSWNLGTGLQSGGLESYPYAADLPAPPLEAKGEGLDDDNRFYPLATTYYRVHHTGGELWFGLAEQAPELYFSLHPTADGTKDAPVLEAITGFWGEDQGPFSLGELPEGHYFLWGAQPDDGAGSVKVQICAGSADQVDDCLGIVLPDSGEVIEEEPKGGCGCATGRGPAGAASPGVAIGLVGLLLARVRRPAR